VTSLSVCLATAASPERVAAVLAPLRALRVGGVEVVLALDDRVDSALDDRYAASADRILRYPYRDPPARVQPWLHSRCRGRWALRLDADEVPSAALAGEIERVVDGDELTHAWIRRAWLWPDAATVLAGWPWRPDYQLRLLRNDPAVVRLPGVLHGFAEAEGARRYLRSPIYHADLLLNSPEERAAKARRYAAIRPGLRIAGRELNEAYYLPEGRSPAPATAAVPPEDRAAITALLEPPAVGEGSAAIEYGEREEIDALWDGAGLEKDDYRARLELLDDDAVVHLGEARTFDVRVTNLGGRRWPFGLAAHPEIRVAQRWHVPEREPIEGLRTPLPHPVGPGEQALVPAQVLAPPEPGRWELEVDLVHEHVRWFGCGVRATVTCVAG
jgi:hypothetical protein